MHAIFCAVALFYALNILHIKFIVKRDEYMVCRFNARSAYAMWPFGCFFFPLHIFSRWLAAATSNERMELMVWVRMRAATIYMIGKKLNAGKVRCARTHRQCRNWNSILRAPSKNSNVKMWFFCLSLLVCQCHCQSTPLMCGVVAACVAVCLCEAWAE